MLRKDDRIRVFHVENMGNLELRNNGGPVRPLLIDHALDADDYYNTSC